MFFGRYPQKIFCFIILPVVVYMVNYSFSFFIVIKKKIPCNKTVNIVFCSVYLYPQIACSVIFLLFYARLFSNKGIYNTIFIYPVAKKRTVIFTKAFQFYAVFLLILPRSLYVACYHSVSITSCNTFNFSCESS